MSRGVAPADGLPVGFEPTPERRQHGSDIRRAEVINDEGVRGRAFRVASSLFSLQRTGDIDEVHVQAAERWYRDFASSEGAHDPEAAMVTGRADPELAVISRIEASAARTEVRRALGMCGEVRLRLLMVDCLSFSAMAAILLPGVAGGRSKLSAQTVLLLEQLAEHYDSVDRARRPRASRTA